MGNLKSIRIVRTKVELSDGQSFDVRAASTNDLMTLVAGHGPTLGLVFGKLSQVRNEGAQLTPDVVREMIFSLAREFPSIAAEIVALAADAYDDDGIAMARDLPITVQVDAIEKVFEMTFASEAQVKKFVESLTRMMVGVSGALTNATPNSETGIGGSEDRPASA